MRIPVTLAAGLLSIASAAAQPVTSFPVASTPLAGSEILYIIQGGINKQISAGNLTPFSSAAAFASPPPIGNITPNTGAFTTLSSNGATLIKAGTLTFTPSGGFSTIDAGTGTLLLKSGSTGSNGLVQAFAPLQAPTINLSSNGVLTNASPPSIKSFPATYSGTQNNGNVTSFVLLGVVADSVANTAGVSALSISHAFGGAAANGPRNTVDINSTMNALSGSTNATGLGFSALRSTGNLMVNDGGTALLAGSVRGSVFGGNLVAHLGPNATFAVGATGLETDVFSEAGSSGLDKIGQQIVQVNLDAVQGFRDDVAMSLNNQPQTAIPGWNLGLGFGRLGGNWPINPAGTMIGAVIAQVPVTKDNIAANGIDLRAVDFTNLAYASPGYQVTGTGKTSIGAGVVAPISTGLSVDVVLSQVSAVAIASGGSSYLVNGIVFGPNGGVYQVASIGGGGSLGSLTILVPDYYPAGSVPANPVTILGGAHVTAATVNFTWTASTTLSLNPSGGPVLMAGLPTSAPGTHCQIWANSGVLTRTTCP
jgi:hypothetical protein